MMCKEPKKGSAEAEVYITSPGPAGENKSRLKTNKIDVFLKTLGTVVWGVGGWLVIILTGKAGN